MDNNYTLDQLKKNEPSHIVIEDPNIKVLKTLSNGKNVVDPSNIVNKNNTNDSANIPAGARSTVEAIALMDFDKAINRRKQEMEAELSKLYEQSEVYEEMISDGLLDPSEIGNIALPTDKNKINTDNINEDYECDESVNNEAITHVNVLNPSPDSLSSINHEQIVLDDNNTINKSTQPESSSKVLNTENSPFNIRIINEEIDEENIDDNTDEDISDDDVTALKGYQDSINSIVIDNKIDLTKFKVSSTQCTASSVIKTQHHRVIDWVLLNTGRIISIKSLSGIEFQEFIGTFTDHNLTNLNRRFTIIYEHDVSVGKPNNLDDWLKSIDYRDEMELVTAIYVAQFSESNYYTYQCKSCNNIWMSDHIDLNSIIRYNNNKYYNNDSKDRFNKIMNGEEFDDFNKIHRMQISNNLVIDLKCGSLYEYVYGVNSLDDAFKEKYANIIYSINFIKDVYKINFETQTLDRVSYPTDKNKIKMLKNKIVTYSKLFKGTLTADQFYLITKWVSGMESSAFSIDFEIPDSVCEKCGNVIPSSRMNGARLLFLRSSLVTADLDRIYNQ